MKNRKRTRCKELREMEPCEIAWMEAYFARTEQDREDRDLEGKRRRFRVISFRTLNPIGPITRQRKLLQRVPTLLGYTKEQA